MTQKGTIFAYGLCVLGFLLSLYLFYPGYFHYDSLVQYAQAQHFTFLNWHPPIMAFVWAIFLRLFPFGPGIFPMLLLQQILFWSSLVIWVFIFERRQKSYLWLIPLFAFFPNIFIYSGVVLKDVQMGNALFLVFALSFLLKQDLVAPFYRKVLFTLVLLLGFYAFCLRHEAVFACLPLFYYWSDLFFVGIKRLYKLLFVVYFALLFGFLSYAFEVMINTYNLYPTQQVLFYDLASMSLHEHKMLIPLEFCRDQGQCFNDIQAKFTYFRVDEILGAVVGFNTLKPAGAHYVDLEKAWGASVLQHPLVYLEARALFSKEMLFYPPEFYGHLNPGQGFYVVSGVVPKAWVTHSLYICNQMAQFFLLWFWLFLNLAALLFLWLKRQAFSSDLLVLFGVLLYSGLLITFAHFFVAAASDFRYNYWLIVSTLFTWTFMVLSLKNERGEHA